MRLWPRRKVYVDDLPKTHDVRFAVFFAFGLAFLLGGLYAVGYYVAGDRVPRGTSVTEVDIGNLTTDEARDELADTVQPRLDRPIRLKGPVGDLALTPRRAGLTFDIDATVQRALDGKSWDPRHMLSVLLGGDQVSPVIAVDQTALDRELGRLAKSTLQPPVDSSVSFVAGEPEIVAGHAGAVVDIPQARQRVIAAFASGSAAVRLPLRPLAPQLSAADAADFVSEVAKPAVSAPALVGVGAHSLRLRPGIFARSLRVESDRSGLHLAIDSKILFARSRAALKALPNRPVNAEIRSVDGRSTVIPSRTGIIVTERALADAVLQAVTRRGPHRAVAQTRVAQARFTTRDAQKLLSQQPLFPGLPQDEKGGRR